MLSLVINRVKNILRGVQFSFWLNICGEGSQGVQIGLINYRRNSNKWTRIIPFFAIRTGK